MAHSQTYTQRHHINMDRLYHPSIPTGNQRHSHKVTDRSWLQFNGGNGQPTTSSPGSVSHHTVTTINKNDKSNCSATTHPVFQSASYDVQQHSMNLSQHIYQRGLLEKIGSDVIVKIPAWQREYHLHRLILDQNPYFQTLLQGGFLETSTNEITLHFEGHAYITADSFQFVLAQLYGKVGDPDINLTNIQPILATCSFFQMESMCELCVEFIFQSLSEYTVVDYLLFADSHLVFGSDKICDAIFTFLCREAYGMNPKHLVGIPAPWFKKIVHSDSFWVPSEYHRYQFIEHYIQQKYVLWRQQKQLSTTKNLSTHQSRKSHVTDYMNYSYQDNDSILTNEDSYQHLQNISESESESESIVLSTSTSSLNSGEMSPPSTQSKIRSQPSPLTGPPELIDNLEIYDDILSHSIHYIHMTFEQLNAIRQDTNPFTNKPLVPDAIIKDALWNQIQIRAKIECATEDEKVLNMTMEDPSSSTSNRVDLPMDPTPYAIPTNDITTYTGESALPHATTSNRNLYYRNRQQSSIPSPSTSPSSQDHYKSTSSSPISISASPDTLQYAQHPPFRFSVEFKDVANLKRNVRVYSKTVFYAGSNWNMYIQKTKSQRKGKGVLQLGVYLHRQSTPAEADQQQQLGVTNSYQSAYSSQNDPTPLHHPHTNSNNPALQSTSFSQYSDKRLVTKTWFKIFCPSRGPKHSLTLFQSTPDDFSVLQSWGWRSTILCADETNNSSSSNGYTAAALSSSGQHIRNNIFGPSLQGAYSNHMDTTIANTPVSGHSTLPSHMANLSLSNSSIDHRVPPRSSESTFHGSDTHQQPCCTSSSDMTPMISSVGSTLRFSVVMGHV